MTSDDTCSERACQRRQEGDRAGIAAHSARTRGRCAARPVCGECKGAASGLGALTSGIQGEW